MMGPINDNEFHGPRATNLSSLMSEEKHMFECDYSHNFHAKCLTGWFENKSECPVCNGVVRADLWTTTLINEYNKAGYTRMLSLATSNHLSMGTIK